MSTSLRSVVSMLFHLVQINSYPLVGSLIFIWTLYLNGGYEVYEMSLEATLSLISSLCRALTCLGVKLTTFL